MTYLFSTVKRKIKRTDLEQVRKRHFIPKLPSFYQDRLGTNIGKALKKEGDHISQGGDCQMTITAVAVVCMYLLRRILVYWPKDLNRDWSPRFSTLRDKTAGFEPKRPEI